MNIRCDRCKKKIKDALRFDCAADDGLPLYMTVGYYDMTGGWAKFKQSSKEKIVCDACMTCDPLYKSTYGN